MELRRIPQDQFLRDPSRFRLFGQFASGIEFVCRVMAGSSIEAISEG